MKKSTPSLLAALLATTLLASCATTPALSVPAAAAPTNAPATAGSVASTAQPITLTLAAAASLEDSFTHALIPTFTEKYPHITVTGSYASSGSLQTQIEEGLAADIFMSAAEKQMNALVAQGLMLKESVVPLLENEIVLIVPTGTPLGIASFNNITKAGSIALGDPESVPAGQYAKEALEALGLWEGLQPSLTLGTDVSQVLNWVAEGSAEAGIVYATDAAQLPDKVTVAAKAPKGSLQAPILYPVATSVLPQTPKYEAAMLFLAFLQSPEAMAVFTEKGFTPVA